jgi:hypothetical protein
LSLFQYISANKISASSQALMSVVMTHELLMEPLALLRRL